MKVLELHRCRETIQLHQQGIKDTIFAYEYASEADRLKNVHTKEEDDVETLYVKAEDLEYVADIDKQKNAMSGMNIVVLEMMLKGSCTQHPE